VEPDHHSGPEQGTGHRAPDPGAGLSHEVPDTHEAAPAEGEAEGEAEGAVTEPAEPPVPEPDPSVRTDAIMSKLPHTRPQRVTGRRHREQARQAAPPKSRAGTAARPATQPKRGTTGARTTAPSARPARRRTAAAVPVTQAATPSDPARRRAEAGNAPGLPRLAVDGAVEAAKLPLRVGGRLTLRALDAAARALRGR